MERHDLLKPAPSSGNADDDANLKKLKQVSAQLVEQLAERTKSLMSAAKFEPHERLEALETVVDKVLMMLDPQGVKSLTADASLGKSELTQKLKDIETQLNASTAAALLERNPLGVALPLRASVTQLLKSAKA